MTAISQSVIEENLKDLIAHRNIVITQFKSFITNKEILSSGFSGVTWDW